MNYVYIATKVLRDLGTRQAAIAYCERIAAQRGVDAIDYQHAADSLRDSLANATLAAGPL
jgi:hypothetical protein